MVLRRLLAVALAAVAVAGCRTDLSVSGDIESGLEEFEVAVVMEGLVASAVIEDPDLPIEIRSLMESTLGVGVSVAAEGGVVVFRTTQPVEPAAIYTGADLTGVKLVTVVDNNLVVVLTQPQRLASAVAEAGGSDESLVNAVFEATSVSVKLTGAGGAVLVEGNSDEVELSGSHLTIRRPLSSAGEARYTFTLPGTDPIVWWGLGGTALLAGAVYWFGRRGRQAMGRVP